MNQLILTTHAVFIGLTPLIPVPALDDLVKTFFYRSLVRSLAAAHDLSLAPEEIALLAEAPGPGCVNGCLFGLGEYLLKRLIRKVIFVLEWRRAIDLVTHAYYIGYLLDYAFQQGWHTPGDLSQARRLRVAIAQARRQANTELVKRIVQASFNQSRQLIQRAVQQVTHSAQALVFRPSQIWLRRLLAVRLRQYHPRLARWLYRRLHPAPAEQAQVAALEKKLAQNLERDTPQMKQTLSGLIAQLQERLAELPQSHFALLQKRLADCLSAAPPANEA